MIKFNKKVLSVFYHFIIWVVLFSFPYILSTGQNQILVNVFAHSWVPLFFYALLFYLNFLVLIDVFLFKKRHFWFAIINIVIIVFFYWLKITVNDHFFYEVFHKTIKDGNGPPKELFIYIQLITYLVPIVFSIALKTTERWKRTEAERKEVENFRLQSELQHLRYQLQPHFFFNSLNNIYSLVDSAPDMAKSGIHSLSKLMRYLLYETTVEEVYISKEIDFLKKYIELMKLRLAKNTKVKYRFTTITTDFKIAPLLFISLIENAFKHGVSANKESIISLEMDIYNDKIIFKTTNNYFPKATSDKSGSGIGLQNLRKRLQLLYPNKHTFETVHKDQFFITTLQIEL